MKLRSLILIGISAIVLSACGRSDSGDGHRHDESVKEWKEMDDFHMAMAEAFHPYKDSTNLAPAKETASDLAKSAREWRDSQPPSGVDAHHMKGKLDELVRLSDEFASKVSSSSDEEIGASLTKLHDLFHDLQNDFYESDGASGDSHEGHHH